MDRARGSQQISLNIRSTQWYQDLIHAPADLAAFCSPLCRAAGEEAKNLLSTIQDVEPPRAVWLTHDAGRLPGLAAALHHGMPEGTSVRILHPEAAAGAVANLLDRWDAGELPRTHLDTTISLPPRQESRVSSGTTRPQPTRR